MFERLKEAARAVALAGVAISCANDKSAEAGLLEKEAPTTLNTTPNIHRYYQIRNDEKGMPHLELLTLKSAPASLVVQDPSAQRNSTTKFAEPTAHKIRSGDTYGKLAEKYYGDSSLWKEIHQCTTAKIGATKADPKKLQVGDTVFIPDKNEILAKRNTAAIEAKVVALKSLPTDIRTKDDDSFVAIAYRAYGNGSHWPVIAALNPGVSFCPEEGIKLRIRCDYGTTIYAPVNSVDRILHREIPPLLPKYPDKMSPQQLSFFTQCAPYALEVERSYGVPAEVAMAQAIHESAWGTRAPGNNYFGIKAGSNWSGNIVNFLTHEENGVGQLKLTKDGFRAYDSCLESFLGYGAFLCSNSRYEDAFYCLADPSDFVEELRDAGYATASNYVAMVEDYLDLCTRDPDKVERMAPAPEGFKYYTIKSGDTFQTISKSQLGAMKHWPIIGRANPGVDSSELKIGQKILVPLKPPPDK